MPLSKKGKKIMKSMKEQYGSKKGKSVFYASKNKGVIKGVEKKKDGGITEKQLADMMRDTDRLTEMDIVRARQALKTRPKKKIKELANKYINRRAKQMTATEGSFKEGGAIRKKPYEKTKDTTKQEYEQKRKQLPFMDQKEFDLRFENNPDFTDPTMSRAKDGGMMKKRRKLQEVEIESDIKKTRPTFPGKPSGPPPVKGPASQGMKNYKNGGIAKGCGKVMNDRRKLTKYY